MLSKPIKNRQVTTTIKKTAEITWHEFAYFFVITTTTPVNTLNMGTLILPVITYVIMICPTSDKTNKHIWNVYKCVQSSLYQVTASCLCCQWLYPCLPRSPPPPPSWESLQKCTHAEASNGCGPSACLSVFLSLPFVFCPSYTAWSWLMLMKWGLKWVLCLCGIKRKNWYEVDIREIEKMTYEWNK